MKKLLPALLLLAAVTLHAQTDSLPSGVYSIQKIAGSTTDLAVLKAHASTLAPGKANHPPRALNDYEELVFVKEGTLSLTIHDSTAALGPGGIALIGGGDMQSFRNASDKPVTYYVLTLQSKGGVNIPRGRQAGGSLVLNWEKLAVKKTEKGESRPVFDRPSTMFSRFEMHATTLNSGQSSHAPHTHRAEEIMLLMQGSATAFINGKMLPVAPGDIMLLTPDVPHNITNSGSGPCWYYAIKWYN